MMILPNEFDLAMLYVRHDRAKAIELCEEMIFLERGQIIRQGTPEDLL
jgi:ABC-type sulfate/molybdate transport systems ATPase subunit